jgi:hypothetical protein
MFGSLIYLRPMVSCTVVSTGRRVSSGIWSGVGAGVEVPLGQLDSRGRACLVVVLALFARTYTTVSHLSKSGKVPKLQSRYEIAYTGHRSWAHQCVKPMHSSYRTQLLRR